MNPTGTVLFMPKNQEPLTLKIEKITDSDQLRNILAEYYQNDKLEYDDIKVIVQPENFSVMYERVEDYFDFENVLNIIADIRRLDNFKEMFDAIDDKEALDGYELWYAFDESFFDDFFSSPYEAACATHFGKVNWADDYIRFDAYGNLISSYDGESYDLTDNYNKQQVLEQWLYENY